MSLFRSSRQAWHVERFSAGGRSPQWMQSPCEARSARRARLLSRDCRLCRSAQGLQRRLPGAGTAFPQFRHSCWRERRCLRRRPSSLWMSRHGRQTVRPSSGGRLPQAPQSPAARRALRLRAAGLGMFTMFGDVSAGQRMAVSPGDELEERERTGGAPEERRPKDRLRSACAGPPRRARSRRNPNIGSRNRRTSRPCRSGSRCARGGARGRSPATG